MELDRAAADGPYWAAAGQQVWRDLVEFACALRRQARIVGALVLREAGLRRGRGLRFGFTLLMLEPILLIGAICLLYYIINRRPIYGTSIVLFIATGVFPVYMFIHTTLGIREPVNVVHVGRYTREIPLDAIIAHTLLRGVSSAVIAMLFFAALYLCGDRHALPHNIGIAAWSLSVVFLLGVGIGVINQVVGKFVPIWDSLWPAVSRASVHFAGMYFVPSYLPPGIRFYLSLNPLAHAVEWFRSAFYPMYPLMILNTGYLYALTLLACMAGLCMERVFRQKLLRNDA